MAVRMLLRQLRESAPDAVLTLDTEKSTRESLELRLLPPLQFVELEKLVNPIERGRLLAARISNWGSL